MSETLTAKEKKAKISEIAVGTPVTLLYWSDRKPAIVVQNDDEGLFVKLVEYEKDNSVELEWVSGGFAGHCVNQDSQKWIVHLDRPCGQPIKVNFKKGTHYPTKGVYGFFTESGTSLLIGEAYYYYDYNF